MKRDFKKKSGVTLRRHKEDENGQRVYSVKKGAAIANPAEGEAKFESDIHSEVWEDGGDEMIFDKKGYETAMDDYAALASSHEERHQAAREKVDRIAYAGKVPVNGVTVAKGAAVGDYVLPKKQSVGIVAEVVARAGATVEQRLDAVGFIKSFEPKGKKRAIVVITL